MKYQTTALVAAVILVTTAAMWATRSHPVAEKPAPPLAVAPNNLVAHQTPQHVPTAPAKALPAVTRDLRREFRDAKNYADYADSVRAGAQGGDSSAQFFLSEALRYCRQNLSRFFIAHGKPVRTLGEAQARWASRPAGYQQEIVEVYERCHAYLEDPERSSQLDEWSEWLDKAANSGVPLAEGTKADVLRTSALTARLSLDSAVRVDPQTDAKAHTLALEALKSRDADVIWLAAQFVDEREMSRDKLGILTGAWQLLACERGYDCSAQAEWVRTACNFDQLCNPGDTGRQYLERHLGDNLAAAKRLANEIGTTLNNGDWSKLPSYLWEPQI
jgi:hypothetical protein